MAWENRNGRDYYYRKRRVGRRVVSEYIGSGIMAELTAELDQADRERRQAERDRLRAIQEENQAVDSSLDAQEKATRVLVRAYLLAMGFHPHKQQWRRRRG